MLRRILYILCLALLGCASSYDSPNPAPAAGTASPIVLKVLPTATDVGINLVYNTIEDSHFAYINPAITAKNRLFVFLPGTGGKARNYRLIVQEAANQGYHAIALTYYNPNAIGDLCNQSGTTDLDCSGRARYEVLTGTDSSSLLSVNPANSIDNRLLRMLQWLQAQRPQDNWAQFYPGNSIDWGKISVAGHSQGGGHALYIGKLRNCLRVTTFASYGDLNINVSPPTVANWVLRQSATPTSSYYGLAAPADELVGWSLLNAGWTMHGMGLAATNRNVDSTASPYNNSRRLYSRLPARHPSLVVGPYHNMMVVDVNTPLDANGRPVLAPAWRYLCLP